MSEHTDTRARVDPQEVAFRKIFIGGLSYSTDEEKLKKYFKQYGTVQDAVVMKDPVSKRSRGFGFITFVEVASVDNALDHEPHTIDSRKVEAKRAVPRSEISRETAPTPSKTSSTTHSSNASTNTAPAAQTSQKSSAPAGAAGKGPSSGFASASAGPSQQQQQHSSPSHSDGKINLEDYAYNKIFVGGLHYDTRDAEFRLYFEKYGKVISAEVMFNRETHKSRGFGFIVFEVENSAVKVCNVKEHSIDGKVVEVKRAIPRSRLPAGTSTAAINAGMVKGPPVSSAGQNSGPAPSKPINSAPTTGASASSTSAANANNNTNSSTSATATKPRSASGSGPSMIATGRKPYSAVAGGQATANAPVASTPASASAAVPVAAAATAATGIATLPRASGVTSYAAALKGAASTLAASHEASMGSILNTNQAAPHLGNSGLNLQTLVYTRLGSTSPNSLSRPSRSYSEPIVKFEGSSELNKDSLPFDERTKHNTNSAGVAIKAPSGKSSRSNSIAQAPANFLFSENGGNVPASGTTGGNNSLTGTPVSLGNLPWLSSPPSNPLDPTGAEFGLQLPPATEQQKQSGLSSTESARSAAGANSSLPVPPGYGAPPPGNNGQWFNSPPPEHLQAQQAFLQHQAAQQQYNQYGGMMYMPPPFGAPPGVAPSPDMWAAMVSTHQMHEHHHQQQQHPHAHPQGGLMGMPPQPYMMPPPFTFFGPDGTPIPFPGATPQQQQMMFFQAQQQMQASYTQMQQLHYQNHAQAVALAQAQAQMAALGAQQQQQQQQQALDGSNKPLGNNSTASNLNSNTLAGMNFPAPGLGYPPVGGLPPATKPSENTENDDLFHFNVNELNLDSPAFDPSQSWISANR
eukprot:gene18286-20822_t